MGGAGPAQYPGRRTSGLGVDRQGCFADYVALLHQGRLVLSASVEDFRDSWGLVRGGLDLLDGREAGLLAGCRRHPHGFEALTPDAVEARRRFGSAAVVERPALEDLVIFTAGPDREAS